ncbi:unnamed protein product [Closterium sp. NIES-53]
MATPSVLTFDAEGCAVDFEVWLDDLQLFLQCDRADGLSLFDLTSGVSPAPPATADSTVRSQWATRDAAARLAVLARYSSPATAALSRLFLPYLFPDLAAFPTVADLITHLRTSDTRYRAALPAEFCAQNPPPLYLTLYYVVTRLPDSLRVVRDHFLSVCPTTLTVDLLEERLLAAEQSIVAVGASRGDPRTPIFEGRSVLRLPLAGAAALAGARGAGALVGVAGAVEVVVEAVEGVGVVVGVVVEVEVSAAAVEAVAAVAVAVVAEEEEVAEAAEAVVERVAALHRGVAPVVVSASSSSAVLRPPPLSSFVSGTLGVSEVAVLAPAPTFSVPETSLFPDATEIPRWGDLSRAGVAVFDLDYDAILAAMYALSTSDEGDCYLCVPPDPGIQATALGAGETAALGASASAAPGVGESAPSGTASAQVFHTFTLDSGASRSFFRDCTTLTPLSRPVAVSLADPSGGPVLASFSTVLPCPAAPSGSLSVLHSFTPVHPCSEANTADIFTKALTPGDHQRFCTLLVCFALLDWSCDLLFSPTLPMGVFLLVPNSFASSFIPVSSHSCHPTASKVVLKDRQFELGFLAAAVPHLCAMLLAPEGDPDALDIPIPRNHAEAVSGPWASY